jgi:PAS domain S-box-containing protein
MRLAKFNFRTRLIAGFGIIILLNILSVIVLFHLVNKSRDNLIKIQEHPFVVTKAINEINNDIYLIWHSTKLAIGDLNNEKTEYESKQIKYYQDKIDRSTIIILEHCLGEVGDIKRMEKTKIDYYNYIDYIFDLLKKGDNKKANQITNNNLAKVQKKLTIQLDVINSCAINKTDELFNRSAKVEKSTIFLLLIFIIITLVISFVVSIIISRSITLPIQKIVDRILSTHDIYVENNQKNRLYNEQEILFYCVSQLEKVTEDLEVLNHQLEAKVIERTQELEISENKFKEIFDKSTDAILIIKNKNFIDCNDATLNLLGYKTKKEFINCHPSLLSPELQPDGRTSFEKAEEMIRIAVENGSHRFEWIHTKSSGLSFPVEVLLTLITNETDNQIIHCVWRDITERKEIELKVIESKLLLNKSQEVAQMGSYSLDLKSGIWECTDELFIQKI